MKVQIVRLGLVFSLYFFAGGACVFGQKVSLQGRYGKVHAAYDALGSRYALDGDILRWDGNVGAVLPLKRGWVVESALGYGHEKFANTNGTKHVFGFKNAIMGLTWIQKLHSISFILQKDLSPPRKTFYPQAGEALTDGQDGLEVRYRYERPVGGPISLGGLVSYQNLRPLKIRERGDEVKFVFDGGDRLILGVEGSGRWRWWQFKVALMQHGVYFVRVDGENVQNFALLTDFLWEIRYNLEKWPISILCSNAMPIKGHTQGWALAGVRHDGGRGITLGVEVGRHAKGDLRKRSAN
ncbi:MAG: hypothetical protein J0L94_07040 [Rhodothermia bacterium]|nr:hypothetical protein [Rhodothermia bacterium]